jgi:metal-dependent amidase/aminoacylase/carboxypeptidase family protein
MAATQSGPTKEQLKQQVLAQIDSQAAEIISIGREIWNNPELGYKEKKTGALMAEVLRGAGASCRTGVGLTGVKGSLKGRGAGGVVAVAGDMDSVICPEHPNADVETGGAHSCGHHGQVTAVLGTAMALAGADAMQWLDGEVQFLGMPAEEYVELDFRRRLVDKGVVRSSAARLPGSRSGSWTALTSTWPATRGRWAGTTRCRRSAAAPMVSSER